MHIRLCEYTDDEPPKLTVGKRVDLDHIPQAGDIVVTDNMEVWRVDFRVMHEKEFMPIQLAATKLEES